MLCALRAPGQRPVAGVRDTGQADVLMAREVIEIRQEAEVDGDVHGSHASASFPAAGGRAV